MEKKQTHIACFGMMLLMVMAGLFFSGCIHYNARPMDADGNLEALSGRSLTDDGLHGFMDTNTPGGVTRWPLESWDFDRLSLAALYFNPKLEAAKAAYAEARAARDTAGERPNPSIGVTPAYNASTPSGSISPWILGINFDIPIETMGKRKFRQSEAQHLSEAALMQLAVAAWEVRFNLRQAMVDLWAVRKQALLFERKQVSAEALVRIGEAQLSAGDIDRNELMAVRFLLQQARIDCGKARGEAAGALLRLSVAVGISPHALDDVHIDFSDFETIPSKIPSADARRAALLNRADILSSLAAYEAKESALRLEIAKQYPDISISPGYEFDQDDNKWQIGFQLTLPIFNRNRGSIAEAEAKRKRAAAEFMSLQARVLGEIETAAVAFQTDRQQLITADEMLEQARQQADIALKQYAAGAVSKQTVLSSQLEETAAALARLDLQVKAQTSMGELEYALQTPLNTTAMPAVSVLMEEE